MALTRLESFPFDSRFDGYDDEGYPVYDRAVGARMLRSAFAQFFSDGIFATPSDAWLIEKGEGLSVTVRPGTAVIKGAVGAVIGDAAPVKLDDGPTVGTACYGVFVRYDGNDEFRSLYIRTARGDYGADPAPPEPESGAEVKELRIGHVTVPSNSTDLSGATIVMEKGSSVCPYAAPFEEIDVAGVLDHVRDQAEAELAGIADFADSVLDGTTAGHLQLQIDGTVKKADLGSTIAQGDDGKYHASPDVDGTSIGYSDGKLAAIPLSGEEMAGRIGTFTAKDIIGGMGMDIVDKSFNMTSYDGYSDYYQIITDDGQSLVLQVGMGASNYSTNIAAGKTISGVKMNLYTTKDGFDFGGSVATSPPSGFATTATAVNHGSTTTSIRAFAVIGFAYKMSDADIECKVFTASGDSTNRPIGTIAFRLAKNAAGTFSLTCDSFEFADTDANVSKALDYVTVYQGNMYGAPFVVEYYTDGGFKKARSHAYFCSSNPATYREVRLVMSPEGLSVDLKDVSGVDGYNRFLPVAVSKTVSSEIADGSAFTFLNWTSRTGYQKYLASLVRNAFADWPDVEFRNTFEVKDNAMIASDDGGDVAFNRVVLDLLNGNAMQNSLAVVNCGKTPETVGKFLALSLGNSQYMPGYPEGDIVEIDFVSNSGQVKVGRLAHVFIDFGDKSVTDINSNSNGNYSSVYAVAEGDRVIGVVPRYGSNVSGRYLFDSKIGIGELHRSTYNGAFGNGLASRGQYFGTMAVFATFEFDKGASSSTSKDYKIVRRDA